MGRSLEGASSAARTRGGRLRLPAGGPTVRSRRPSGSPHAVRLAGGVGARLVGSVELQP